MESEVRQKSPLELFFKLGDKVTKGDPMRKLDFDYYMMWIIFLAFGFVFTGNIWRFFTMGYQLANLGWGLFGLAIMWFQYYNLKNIWSIRKFQKEQTTVKTNEPTISMGDRIETVDEMLREFKK